MVKETHDGEYLRMVQTVLEQEQFEKENRTNTPTIGITGYKAEYPMDEAYYEEDGSLVIPDFPLLTTKKVFWKGVVAELFWLLNGQTNILFLEKNGVHIWREWPMAAYNKAHDEEDHLTKKQFTDKILNENGFAERWGDLGPVYGKQWRAWDQHVNNTIQPIDQVLLAVNTLRHSPSSRRNIISSWNVAEIEDMQKTGLPPCHTLFQFIAVPDEDAGYILDLVLYQRSLDVFLGAPFNIASYSLLLCMFAEHVGMLPGTFIHMIGDCHIYTNHIPQMKEQIQREPKSAPTVVIKPGLMQKILELPVACPTLDFEELNKLILLEGYESHDAIKGEVAV